MLSFLAGIGTVIIIWKFLADSTSKYYASVLTFVCIAFNPQFIGITSQATNDSFIIFFSSLSFFAMWKYLQKSSIFYAILLIIGVVLSILSKGTGWVVYGSITAILLLEMLFPSVQKKLKRLAIIFLVYNSIFFIAVIFFTPYPYYYQKYHNPFIINATKPTVQAAFFKKSYVGRPGVTSIVDSFYTFRLDDLLLHPYVINSPQPYFINRTSYWSQIYAQFNSIHFLQFPPSWGNTSVKVLSLTRSLLIMGLPLGLIMVLGYLTQIVILIKKFLKHSFSFSDFTHSFLFVFYFSVILVCMLYYAYAYRDFSFMKAIFLFPGIVCIAQFLHTGIQIIMRKLMKWQYLQAFFSLYLITLCILYIYDVSLLIGQLWGNIGELY